MARPTPPLTYTRNPQPLLPGADARYLQDELAKLEQVLANIALLTPQVATAAPKTLVDGMIRLARAPWRPTGGTADLWVRYDAAAGTWTAF